MDQETIKLVFISDDIEEILKTNKELDPSDLAYLITKHLNESGKLK